MRRLSIYTIAICAALGLPMTASAGTVDLCNGAAGWSATWAPQYDGLVEIIAAECGELAAGRVYIEKSAEFIQPAVNGVFPGIPIVFNQTAITNVVRIIIEDEIIINSTGQPWTDFHMALTGAAVFDPNGFPSGPPPIGFSIAPFTTAVFSNGNTQLDIAGGVLNPGDIWFPGSGASDGELHIVATPTAGQPFATFTLIEQPTPEPSALTLLGFGAITLLGRRRS